MSEIVQIPHDGKCQYEGCNERATVIACGRQKYESERERPSHPFVGIYCEDHGYMVADEGNPEYHHECPNCDCVSGVN